MNHPTVLMIMGLVAMYLILGASVFQILEQPFEAQQQLLISSERDKFLNSHSCVDGQELVGLIRHVVIAIEAGVDPIGNWANSSKNWDLSNSFFFSGTVITTIGFGSTAPKSKGGRIFCVFYALVGIPMFGFLLAGVGELLGSALGNLISKVEYIVLRWNVGVTVVRVISTLLSIVIGCLIFVGTPVFVFQYIEKWTLLESVYFVVVTLTTIGFGDYVTGRNPQIDYYQWYQPLVWLWIIVGLAYFAAILSMIGDWLRVLSQKTKAEVGGLTAHWTKRSPGLDLQERLLGVGRKLSTDQGVMRMSSPVTGNLLVHVEEVSGLHGPRETPLQTLLEVSGTPVTFSTEGLVYIDSTPGSSPAALSPSSGPSPSLTPRRWIRQARREPDGQLGDSEAWNRTRDKGESV